jgi:hypothetical protein
MQPIGGKGFPPPGELFVGWKISHKEDLNVPIGSSEQWRRRTFSDQET